MNELHKKLGEKIARHRRAAGWSQAKLAELIDVQPETVSRIEGGRMVVSLRLLNRISKALDLELHDLFRWSKTNQSATDRILIWSSRMSEVEIELVMDVAGLIIGRARKLRLAARDR